MSPLLLSLFACDAGKAILDAEGLYAEEEIIYTLTVTEPEYGAFYQQGPIPVEGVVIPYIETVLLEGQEIPVNEDGSFSGEVNFSKAYEIVEVEVPEGELRERIPVFAGSPPMDTWPGGMAERILPEGAVGAGV